MASKSSKLPRAARASVDDQRMEQAERASTETFTNEMDGPERGQTTGPEAADLRAAEPLPGPGFAEHDPNQRIALSDIPRRRLDDDPLADGWRHVRPAARSLAQTLHRLLWAEASGSQRDHPFVPHGAPLAGRAY